MKIFKATAFGKFITDKPKLIHLEKHSFLVLIRNQDGSPFDLSGFETAEAALNNTFDHQINSLMAYAGPEECMIVDSIGGVIQVTLNCNTIRFGEIVQYDSQTAFFEINLFDSEANLTRILLDEIECKPHVRDQEGAPVSGDPGYYNKVETNALIKGACKVQSVNGKTGVVELGAEDVGAIKNPDVPGLNNQVLKQTQNGPAWENETIASVNGKTGVVILDASDVGAIANPEAAGTTGQVLTQTANGPAWKSPEQIVPVTVNSFSPQSGIYYTQTAPSGDVNYTFTFNTAPVTFEFWITKTSSGAWNFATASGIDCWWEADGSFAPENPPPDMTATNIVYQLTFRWDGSNLLANLAYKKAIEVSA